MKIVYVVTSGEYSDYGIDAIFSEKKLSEEYIENGDGTNIEEWYLDVPREGWEETFVRMKRDGTVVESGTRGKDNQPEDFGFICFDVDANLVCRWDTADTKRAIKSTNEIRSMLLAREMWPEKISYPERGRINKEVREMLGK